MKITIWKSDLDQFNGLRTFIACNQNDIIEFKNFYIFTGNCNPYELHWIQNYDSSGKNFSFTIN